MAQEETEEVEANAEDGAIVVSNDDEDGTKLTDEGAETIRGSGGKGADDDGDDDNESAVMTLLKGAMVAIEDNDEDEHKGEVREVAEGVTAMFVELVVEGITDEVLVHVVVVMVVVVVEYVITVLTETATLVVLMDDMVVPIGRTDAAAAVLPMRERVGAVTAGSEPEGGEVKTGVTVSRMEVDFKAEEADAMETDEPDSFILVFDEEEDGE